MTDAAFENARARESQLEAEIEKAKLNLSLMQSELRSVQQFIHNWKVFSGLIDRAPDEFSHPTNMLIKSSSKEKNSRKEDVAEGARRIIEERGEPVSRSSLYEALTKNGYVINGTDPEMVLSTMLWRMRDRVERLKTGGYWIPGKPLHKGIDLEELLE